MLFILTVLSRGDFVSSQARREREKENMRSAILEAATKIILEEGYDNLTMRKIADAIEYTPTTIYNYYKNKAQIIEDIVLKIYTDIVSNIKKTLESDKYVPIDRQLWLIAREFINTMVGNPEMGKAVFISGTEAMVGPKGSAEPATENDGILLLRALLKEGQDQSILRKLDDNAAEVIISALLGFSMYAILVKSYLHENWHGVVDIYAEILVNGLLEKS